MKMISLNEIAPALEMKFKVIEAVKQDFISHCQGGIDMTEPVQMIFGASDYVISGDCHIKTISGDRLPYFSPDRL